MSHESEQSVVVVRKLMHPRVIRLISVGVLSVSVLMFWISQTLPEPVAQYSWLALVGFFGAAILGLWGFAVAQRRDWWLKNQAAQDADSETLSI